MESIMVVPYLDLLSSRCWSHIIMDHSAGDIVIITSSAFSFLNAVSSWIYYGDGNTYGDTRNVGNMNWTHQERHTCCRHVSGRFLLAQHKVSVICHHSCTFLLAQHKVSVICHPSCIFLLAQHKGYHLSMFLYILDGSTQSLSHLSSFLYILAEWTYYLLLTTLCSFSLNVRTVAPAVALHLSMEHIFSSLLRCVHNWLRVG